MGLLDTFPSEICSSDPECINNRKVCKCTLTSRYNRIPILTSIRRSEKPAYLLQTSCEVLAAGAGLEDEIEERQASARREEAPADDFEDEMAGFIDDDDLEGGRRPKRGQVRGIPGGIDSAALQVQGLHASDLCAAGVSGGG